MTALSQLPRTLLGLEYKAARYPTKLLETKVLATRLEDDSRVRLTIERVLGTLDGAAGSFLGDEGLAERGRVLTRRVEVFEKAVELEAKAAERRQAADVALQAELEEADRQKALVQQEHEQKSARLKAERDAEAKAIERKAAARQKADVKDIRDTTEKMITQERDRLDAQTAKIEAKVKLQTAAPKADLALAGQEKQKAAKRRADADTLAELRQA